MKKCPIFIIILLLSVCFTYLSKAGFDAYHGYAIKQVLEVQQFYSATTAAISYSNDIDLNSYTGTMQAIKDFSLGTQASTAMALKFQSSALQAGQSYTGDPDTGYTLRSGAATNVQLAASFTQGTAIHQIKDVRLRLKAIGTIAAGKILTLAVYADSSGPTGSALATAGTVLCSTVPTADYGVVKFTFTTPYALAASTKYWLVLTGDYDTSTSNAVKWGSTTITNGGNYAHYDSGWTAVSTQYLWFMNEEYNFVDVTGGAFTNVTDTTGNGLEVIAINKDNIGQFVRTKMTLTGSYPTFTGTVLINGQLNPMTGP